MAVQNLGKPGPAPATPTQKAGSFLGWAFLISLLIHAVTLPFFGLTKQESKKESVEKVSVSKKIKVVVPTPPPPTPTPPPPTPPPKATPPPVKQTNPPPQPKLRVNPPKTTNNSAKTSSSEQQYVAPAKGSEQGVPQGTVASAPAVVAPVSTAAPATPAPTPTPTLKPTCANPNSDAVATNSVQPDYPDIAKEQGAQGVTQVKVTLDATGGVTSAIVFKSAGNASLDNAAITAAKQSKYQPEIVNCVKTAGSYIFRAEFAAQ